MGSQGSLREKGDDDPWYWYHGTDYHGTSKYRGTVVPTVHGTCWYQLASLYLRYRGHWTSWHKLVCIHTTYYKLQSGTTEAWATATEGKTP